ncbi:MAG: hypothetical protein JXK05_03160 [Campylobacterales bacterium]|nr:hypothetical protein [Campylobacterales bacterium]
MSLLYFVLLPLLALFLMPLYRKHLHIISVMLNLTLLTLALTCTHTLPMVERVAVDLPFAITFVLERASWLLLTLFTLIMSLVSLYHLRYGNDKALFVASTMLGVGVSGLILSHDLFNIYIFFEISSISAYLLTALNQDVKAYGGAIRYMIVGAFASLFLLLGIMLIYLSIGVLDIGAIAERFGLIEPRLQFLILLSLFIGFGIKAELFGLNFWVADIYQASRSSVGSLFSALLSKSYLFVLFHLTYLLHVSPSQLFFLGLIGALTFVAAEFSAFKSHESKRIFAFSTLGQIGIITLALSYADAMLSAAALMLILTHAVAKTALFLALDLLERHFHSSHSTIFARFHAPFLMGIIALAGLSLLGIPPFAGFVAKLSILTGLASLEAYGAVALILLISLIEAAYLFRLLTGFRQGTGKERLYVAWSHKLLLGFMVLLLLGFGLMPEPLLQLCQAAAASMLGGNHVPL